MRTLLALLITLTACVTEDEPPPPTCEEIGAPDSLACNAHGLCTWEGAECCRYPRPGTDVDPACESVLQPR